MNFTPRDRRKKSELYIATLLSVLLDCIYMLLMSKRDQEHSSDLKDFIHY